MIVIADTSPLHYLILVQVADVLPRLFQRVLIPDEVHAELRHPGAPALVRLWIIEPPDWLEIQSAVPARVTIADLDAGQLPRIC
jgi:predicted nucleic acid-binding protein